MEASPDALRLIVADPHAGVREAIGAALETEPGLRIVDEAADAAELLATVARSLPDVVLVDLSLVLEHREGLIREILERSPSSRVVVLSSLESDSCIEAALSAGAAGHARKDAFREDLIGIIRDIGRGSPAGASLTAREVAILRLVARGRSNREIGETLSISEGTVKGHLQRVFHKLGVGDRTQATITALKRGAIRL